MKKVSFTEMKHGTKEDYLFLDKLDLNISYLKREIFKNKMKFPIVIKPNDEGSSIGVKICSNVKILYKVFPLQHLLHVH